MINFKHCHADVVRHTLMSCTAIAGIFWLAAPAYAQVETESADDQADAGDAYDGAIVVTAQKRSEALQDVPISISAVSGEALEQRNISAILDLPQTVPSLRINYAGTFVLPTIRGVGSIVALPGLTQNIATYVDGYYIPTPSASNFSLANVESVSVLKGPQGTLFGANATGGAIQIQTREPEYQTSGLVRLGYSSYDNVKAEAYVTTGLTDFIAVDVAANYEYGNGYVTNIANDDDHYAQFRKYSFRTKALIEPTSNLRFTLAYEHSYADDPISQMVVPRDGITQGRFDPGATITFDSPKRVALNNQGFAVRESNSYTLTSELDLGGVSVTSYTGYRTDVMSQGLDYDATSSPMNFSNWVVDDSTFTQEINIASNGSGPLTWVLGGFYLKYKDAYDFNVNGSDIFRSKNETESYSGFADVTYEAVDNLFLTGGIRYTEDKPCVDYLLEGPGIQDAGCTKFDNVSVRAVGRYQITNNTNIYASYSQGYRSGGLPGSAFSLVPVEPETIDAFEIGFKTADYPLRFNIAAFYYDYKDIQVTNYGAGGQSMTVNAAKAEIYGIDGDLSYNITEDLQLSLSGSWTHAKYKDFPNALGRNLDPTSPSLDYLEAIPVDATGFRVERTPRFSGNAAVNYGFDLGGGRMALNANVFYTGSYYFDPAHQLKQPAYTLVNLKATWTDPSEHLDFSVFAKNAFNEEYFVSSFLDPTSARARYGEPSIFGGSITYRY